jgi:hypothetical protein
LGRDFVIDYIAWRHIIGWILTGGILLSFGIFLASTNPYAFFLVLFGVICIIFGVWFSIGYFQNDDYYQPQTQYNDYYRSRPDYYDHREPIERQNLGVGAIKSKIPKFCPECGVPTGGRKFCSECGEKLY